jgi:hypothetical protein
MSSYVPYHGEAPESRCLRKAGFRHLENFIIISLSIGQSGIELQHREQPGA